MLFHNLHGICRCLPAVDQNRKIQLSCQFQLPYEPFFLHFSWLIVPVIIQTDLAYRNHFLLFKQLFHLCKVLFIQAADLIRMNPDCRIYKWIFLCKCNNLPAGIICCTDIYNCANALLFHRIQQFYSVLIKLLIVIMCMCIKYHISSVPNQKCSVPSIPIFIPSFPHVIPRNFMVIPPLSQGFPHTYPHHVDNLCDRYCI